MTRVVRKFETKKGKVAKLFAKHIKLKEAVENCKTTRWVYDILEGWKEVFELTLWQDELWGWHASEDNGST